MHAVQDTTYLVYPRIDTKVCDTIRDDVGPTLHAMLLTSAVSRSLPNHNTFYSCCSALHHVLLAYYDCSPVAVYYQAAPA